MIISSSKKFIFVHVPKVSGRSIKAVLEPYNNRPHRLASYKSIPDFIKAGKLPRIFSGLYHAHTRANVLRARMPASIFDNYYKFAFVRNPWDRQVSVYHYILRQKDHKHHALIRRMDGFEQYLEWRVQTAPVNQTYFLFNTSGNRLLVDFIGRFENLETDFEKVCDRLGLTEAKLPHKNRSIHKPYQEYYTDETRALVAEYWQDDIEAFGYSFD